MGLGEVFSGTWADYKKNFWTNTKVMLLFYLLPMLIVLALGIGLFYSSGLDKDVVDIFGKIVEIQGASGNLDTGGLGLQGAKLQAEQIMQNPELVQLQAELTAVLLSALAKGIWVILALVALGIIAGFVSVYGLLAIFAPALKKKGSYGFKEAVREAKPYYWRHIGLVLWIYLIMFVGLVVGIIMGVLTFGLGMLVVYAALVWLFILWIFTPYIIVDMNKGVFDSMKESKKIVRGKWWKTLGYLLLIGLIILIIFGIVSSILNMISVAILASQFQLGDLAAIVAGSFDISTYTNLINMLVVSESISMIISSVILVVILPYMLLFVKNMYQSFKKEKKH